MAMSPKKSKKKRGGSESLARKEKCDTSGSEPARTEHLASDADDRWRCGSPRPRRFVCAGLRRLERAVLLLLPHGLCVLAEHRPRWALLRAHPVHHARGLERIDS